MRERGSGHSGHLGALGGFSLITETDCLTGFTNPIYCIYIYIYIYIYTVHRVYILYIYSISIAQICNSYPKSGPISQPQIYVQIEVNHSGLKMFASI